MRDLIPAGYTPLYSVTQPLLPNPARDNAALHCTMPSLSADANLDFHIVGGHPEARTRLTGPLTYSGSLDAFEHVDCTPAIGREYTGLQIHEMLSWDEQHIRDLAITGKCPDRLQPSAVTRLPGCRAPGVNHSAVRLGRC